MVSNKIKDLIKKRLSHLHFWSVLKKIDWLVIITMYKNVWNLLHSYEKAVNIVPWGAGVQSFFVLLYFHFDEHLQLPYMLEKFVLRAWQMLHDPGKDVVHLKEGSILSCAAKVPMACMQILFTQRDFKISFFYLTESWEMVLILLPLTWPRKPLLNLITSDIVSRSLRNCLSS